MQTDDYTADVNVWANFDVESMNQPEEEDDNNFTCGEFKRYLNPLTGQFRFEPRWCRKYHICPICRARKNKALLDRLTPLTDNPQVRVIFHNQPISELNEKFDSRLHIPIDGGYYSVVQSDDNSIGQPLTKELAEKISAHGVAPKGKRISGDLGKVTASVGKNEIDDQLIVERPEEVKRRVFKYTDENGNMEDLAIVKVIERETISETSELNPQDADQLQDAIYVREQKLIEVAKKYNVEILFLYTETIQVLVSKINWLDSRKL